jgi:hypothetical protein
MAFNRAQRRQGAGPLSSIIEAREDESGRESSKSNSGAEKGTIYTSNLGEKRSIK